MAGGLAMPDGAAPFQRAGKRHVLRLPRGRELHLTAGQPAIMGILNVTPDSFSDGGTHFALTTALEAALRMIDDGAAIIDVGGESTRPGAVQVTDAVEIERAIPLILELRRRSDIPISIDTRKSAVAAEALSAGADMVNDVSALRFDPLMGGVVARARVPVILMHMRGSPATMQQLAVYEDVTSEVGAELSASFACAVAAGIESGQIAIDPGIGFAKNLEHNLTLLANLRELAVIGPLVVGASRKAYVGHLTGRPSGPERMAGSLAGVAAAQRGGASLVRVHDVRATSDFLRVISAIAEKQT